MSTAAVTETVGGHQLKFTNLDKVLYPEVGFTKGEIVDYYRAVAPVLLPHLRGRPLTMKRYPNGVDGQFFFQKKAPKHRRRLGAHLPGAAAKRRPRRQLPGVERPAGAAVDRQPGRLELHVPLSRERSVQRPTALVFDLDPGAPAGVIECCLVAQLLRELGKRIGLELFPKTSGSKGLQVYAPLRGASFADTKPFARRSPSCSRTSTRSWWSRRCEVAARRARCWSTGARTTTRRPPSASTRCGPGRSRPCRRR